MAWTWLAAALAKLGQRLIKPKDQKALKDQSSRQINIFSKVKNVTIVKNPRTNEFYIGNYADILKEILGLVRRQFDPQKPAAGEQPEFRIIRDDFFDDITDFQAHLEKEDELLRTISPHIEPQFASIFRLASYAKSFYDRDERRKGDEVKAQVGHQYGRDGRKLCNLYIKGYISDMFQHYLEAIFKSARDKNEIGVQLNTLIRNMILFSENIFFIHHGSDVGIITARIRIAVKKGEPYIALHSAGIANVEKTYRIVEEVGPDFLEENGYNLVQERPASTASIPFFDVYITRGRRSGPSDDADQPPKSGADGAT